MHYIPLRLWLALCTLLAWECWGVPVARLSLDPWPDSDLVAKSTNNHGSADVLVSRRTWHYGLRLQSITNTAFGGVLSSYAYQYDEVNRRRRVDLSDSTSWDYGYNDLNELISGQRHQKAYGVLLGQRFEYGFDSLGNHLFSRSGGDSSGENLRYVDYGANWLNQYTNIQTLGYKTILGLAASANVTVDGGAAQRKDTYFWREITVNNGSGPAWQVVTINDGSLNRVKKLLFPPFTQTTNSVNPLRYDEDGNLISDGLWTYIWDAENRLIKITSQGSVPEAAARQIEFQYDYLGRRIKKIVSTRSGQNYVNPVTTRYLYDGWRLVAELSGSSGGAILRSYAWGMDLSHTLDEAGGVGGLVVITDHTTGSHFFPAFDGNGNVTALVQSTNQTIAARYEYGPFGELLRANGSMARLNPFRFSTKFWDEETGLVNFGMRDYRPEWGRWLNRDPMEEKGGLNPYAYCKNNAANLIDPIGLFTGSLSEEEAAAGMAGEIGAGSATAAGGIKAMASYLVAELALQAYDTYELYETLADPESKRTDMVLATSGYAAGLLLPGAGYTTGVNATAKGIATKLT